MATEMPVSTRVKCSRCGEFYELGDFCLDNEGKKLPWLVLSQSVTSVKEALAHVLCQECHGYKEGESVQLRIENLGVQTTAAPRLLTRQEINTRVEARKERVSIGLRSSPAPDGRKPIGMISGPGILRTPIGLLANPVGSQRKEIGVNQSSTPARSQIGAIQPQIGSGRREIRPILPVPIPVPVQSERQQMQPKSREQVQRPIRGANLGEDLLGKLELAHTSGDHREFNRILVLAVQANLRHSLTNDAINAKFDAERKAREDERKAEQIRREKPFKTALSQAKRFLTLARKLSGNQDAVEEFLRHVDSMEDQIEKALKSDLKMRSYVEILALVGLTIRELHELRVSDCLGKTAVPDPTPRASIGTFVNNISCMYPTKSRLPRANPPFAMQLDVGHMPEVFPKIVYEQGDEYGQQPYIMFPDGRYEFVASVNAGDEPESFMGIGQFARMEYVDGYGWGYQPYATDNVRLHSEFRFGTFERGYVTLDQIVAESLAVTVIETVTVVADGSTKVGTLAIASVLMKSGNVKTFEIPFHPDLLGHGEVILVSDNDATQQMIDLLPRLVAYREQITSRSRGSHPTMSQCVVLPPQPRM